MDSKKYSVFISSTFEDLRAERQKVQDVIIRSGDFPVQMESFPAADEEQFDFIKSLINRCDYYLLIVAGRYGTVNDKGISYTELEYDYAVEIGMPILAMLHGDRSSITLRDSEKTEEGKARLADFIGKVEKNRLRKVWRTSDELMLSVRESLDYAKATKPSIGWVRGNTVATLKALEELNQVRKENSELHAKLEKSLIDIPLPPMPHAEDKIQIEIFPNSRSKGNVHSGTALIETTWIDIFPIFFNNLKVNTSDWNGDLSYYVDDDKSCIEIGSTIAGAVSSIDAYDYFKISKHCLNMLSSFYVESGLMNQSGSEEPFTELAHKLSRRRIIAGPRSIGKIIHGKINVAGQISRDDDIPF